MSVGERIAFYRRRRGMTQRVLAELVGRSEDWLSKIERGDREVRRVDVLADLARQLRVNLTDLVGAPVLMEEASPADDDVPAIRHALMDHKRLSPTLFAQALTRRVDEANVARLTEFAWQDYQAGRLGAVVRALPRLIESGRALEEIGTAEGLLISSRIHHLAASTLAKIGEADLAWIAAEAAVSAGERSGDPLALASAARAGTHALLAVGRFDDAVNLGETAAAWLRQELVDADPAAWSLIGMLQLRTAVAAARRQDRALTNELLNAAAVAAQHVGHDANHWFTAFGPTNVELHRISTALDLQDFYSVVDRGDLVQAGGLPAERAVTLQLDLARANAYVARDDEALRLLLDAEAASPDLVRHSAAVREVVKAMHRRTKNNGAGSALYGLAMRCRAVA